MRKLFGLAILWAVMLVLVISGTASAQEERYDNVYLLRFDPHHILVQVRCDVPSTPITIYFGDGSAEETMDCIPDFGGAQQYYPFAEHFYPDNGLVLNYPIKIQVGAETHYLVVEIGAPVTEDVPFIAWYSVPDASTPNRVFLRSNMCHLLPHEDGAFPNVPVDFGDGSSTVSPCSSLSSGSKTEHWYPQNGEPNLFVATVGGIAVEVYDGETEPDEQEILPFLLTVNPISGTVNSFVFGITRAEPWEWIPVDFGDGGNTDAQIIDGVANVTHDYPLDGRKAFTFTVGWLDGLHYTGVISITLVEDPRPEPPPADGFELDVTKDQQFNRYWFQITGADEYDYIHVDFGDGSQTDAAIDSDGTAMVPHDYPIGDEPQEFYWSAGVIGEDPSYLGIIAIMPPNAPEPPEPPIQQPVKIEVNQVGMSNHVDFIITECVAGMYYPLDFGDDSKTDVLCESNGTATVPHDYPWTLQIKEYFWLLGVPDAILGSGVINVGELDEAVFLPVVTN